ncbi:hypothetical protein D3C72_2184780 [compost metagenome]
MAAVQQAGVSVGMRSMHARIARAGGTLKVSSSPGSTLLTARVELRAAQHDDAAPQRAAETAEASAAR